MLISVIIPFYNRFEFVNNAICSVLNQTYHNWELILIDDRSDEIYISNFHDDRIKLIRNDMNIGPGASRQKGIEYSNGDFICFLDSDDIYLPRFLESQLKAHIKHNFEISFSFCKSIWMNGEMYKDHAEEMIQILPNLLIKSRPWPTCALLWNRKFLPYWRSELRTWEDYQFEYDAAFINNKIACVNEVLCQINLDEEYGLSQNSEKISGIIDRLTVLSNMSTKNLESNLEFKSILNQNILFRIKKDIYKLAQFNLPKSEYFLILNKLELIQNTLHRLLLNFIYQKPILSKIMFKYFF
jgi:glycosyltransferase involved in cell wall biosynthesis